MIRAQVRGDAARHDREGEKQELQGRIGGTSFFTPLQIRK